MTRTAENPTPEPENHDNEMVEQPNETSQLPATQMDRYVQTFQEAVNVFNRKCDALTAYIAPRNNDENLAPENLARSPIVFGMLLIVVLFGVFGIWAALAPIDSAAIAQGTVVLNSSKKTIDHLEGGIVEEILVSEGQYVETGQLLVRLDGTASKARLDLYKGQYYTALASEARLKAERDNKDEVEFPEALLKLKDSEPDVAANIDSQTRLFKTRREAVNGKLEVLQQKIKQSDEEINGLQRQIQSDDQQMSLLNEEISDVRHLLKQGNAPKTRLLNLERTYAEVSGDKGKSQALVSRSNQNINENKIEMFNLKTQFLNEVVGDLKDIQSKLSDLQEQMRAAQDIVSRIEIKAPIAGQVIGLTVHTVGGVIGPNQPLMEIIPKDDQLVIEAKIKPQDIDVVRVGLKARLRLLAYRVRYVPLVEGTVRTVSSDRFEDKRTGEPYFIARIVVDDDQLKKLKKFKNVELSPGMPAEALIVTGSRSMLGYLASPIHDSFNRAFREQ